MKLNDLKEPAIIISASGMCEAGASGTISKTTSAI